MSKRSVGVWLPRFLKEGMAWSSKRLPFQVFRYLQWGYYWYYQPKLVGGIPTPLKDNSQLGLLFPTEREVIKFMFQTTYQKMRVWNHHWDASWPKHRSIESNRKPHFWFSVAPCCNRDLLYPTDNRALLLYNQDQQEIARSKLGTCHACHWNTSWPNKY